MKNIHILPTDKPSRLHYFTANKSGYYLYPNNELVVPRNSNCINQNIYITSDEVPKLDEWGINTKNNVVFKCKGFTPDEYDKKYCKRIILTTDELYIHNDLIPKEYNPFPQYIQKIDDEFLEWFVAKANDSGKPIDRCEVKYDKDAFPYGVKTAKGYGWYKIIIPSVEPKQDWFCPKCDSYVSSESVTFEETHQICNTGVVVIEEPKQETLEEFCIEFVQKHFEDERTYNPSSIITAMKVSAKWQQERSYSEMDIVLILSKFRDMKMIAFSEWFEQFKKK